MAAANKNFFESMKASYTDVPIDESKDNAISTTQFLDASESLAGLFGRLVRAELRHTCSRKVQMSSAAWRSAP